MAAEPVNALEVVLGEVEALLEPVLQAAEGPQERELLFLALGWDVDAITGLPIGDIDAALSAVPPLVTALADGLDVTDFPKILDALQAASEAIGAISELDVAARTALPAIPADALALDLLNFLVVRYVHTRFPRVYAVLSLATIVDLPSTPTQLISDPASEELVFDGVQRPVIRFDRLPRLITDPAGLFEEVYWPGGITDQASADAVADRLLPRVAALVRAFGGHATYGVDPSTGLSFGDASADGLVAHMLSFRQPLPLVIGDDGATLRSELGLTVGFVAPDAHSPAGVVLVPSGNAQVRGSSDPWLVDLALEATPGGIVVTRDGVIADLQAATLDADLTVARLPGAAGAAVLIGSRAGTHFAIGTIRLSAGATFDAAGVEPRLGLDLLGMQLVIKAGDGDSFLKAVLPPDGMRMPMELGLAWSPSTGVVMHGGATLEIDLPIDLDLVLLKIPVVHLSLGVKLPAEQPPELALGVGATVELELGPVYAAIEKMGIALVATFPPQGGNLGPMDVGLRFLPPRGVALSVDAGPVSGGGYLFADFDKGEYGGILHLDIAETIAITAIGLLQTRMPDGSEGFSLVVIISAEFPPIQLGYGFSLSGIGGIVGINRSMNVPALQDGLRRGAIGSLLFPSDPVPRARQIIADVGAIFPPTEGQFVVGPMIKLGWGAGMVTGTLAVVIQFPALKIALLGRIELMVPPVEEAAIVLLRLDFAGILDVPAQTVSFDGSLDGSRIAIFTVTGDIAMRASFGAQPDFALSVGGLHPAYRAPPGFPALRRLTLALAESDNPRLRMEAYFAVTPATLQFGGRAELYYGVDIPLVGLIEVDASAGLDALITFPATFVVDIDVHVLLRRNGEPFIGVELDIRIAGAQPLDVDGHATLHFFGEHRIPFHATIGGATQVPELAPVNLEGQVLAALADPRSWSAKPPAGATAVRLREAPDDGGPLRVHPLGALAVHQTVAPLDVTLEKAGEAEIAGPRRLTLTTLTVAGAAADAAALPKVSEQFAASQFFRLTERQRLEQPAFEPMQAGVEAQGGGVQCTGVRAMPLGFEELAIPPEEDAPPVRLGVRRADEALLGWMVGGGVAAKGAAAQERRFGGPAIGIVAGGEGAWVVAERAAPTVGGLLANDERYATAAEAHVAARGRDVVVAPAGEAVA